VPAVQVSVGKAVSFYTHTKERRLVTKRGPASCASAATNGAPNATSRVICQTFCVGASLISAGGRPALGRQGQRYSVLTSDVRYIVNTLFNNFCP
jgi:hypothetical protein